jgi:glycosyltransferase involved in cell wall biosynthesis
MNGNALINATTLRTDTLQVSVVVPLYNEVESVPHLVNAIATTLTQHQLTYEIVAVDDGSKDGTVALLKALVQDRADLRIVLLRRNYGQTAAMSAGFNHAKAKTIVTIDGDLQNDPQDIPKLLAKLEEGYDVVSGWRKHRQDKALTRRLPSKIANWLFFKGLSS